MFSFSFFTASMMNYPSSVFKPWLCFVFPTLLSFRRTIFRAAVKLGMRLCFLLLDPSFKNSDSNFWEFKHLRVGSEAHKPPRVQRKVYDYERANYELVRKWMELEPVIDHSMIWDWKSMACSCMLQGKCEIWMAIFPVCILIQHSIVMVMHIWFEKLIDSSVCYY